MILQLPQWPTTTNSLVLWTLLAICLVLLLTIRITTRRPSSNPTVPVLSGLIPTLSITLLYMTDMRAFFAKAKPLLRKSATGIIQFQLGPYKTYLISGPENIATIFRASANVGCDLFFLTLKDSIWGATKEDMAKFARDRSGHSARPAAGCEDMPEEERVWYGIHTVMATFMTRKTEVEVLSGMFERHFGEVLERRFPVVGEEGTVGVFELLKGDMAAAVIKGVNGTRIVEEIPDLIALLWDFDLVVARLAWGLPRWMARGNYEKRDRFHGALMRYLEGAIRDFDWESEENPEWEPIFGSRFSREFVRWMVKSGFSLRTMAGGFGSLTLFAANANSLPTAAWCLLEILRSPSLLASVGSELAEANIVQPDGSIDRASLLSLPLLQSIYTENLRLHVSMNVTRQVTGPLEMSGVKLEEGSVLQACTDIVHHDEEIWGVEGHGAEEFWAERHIKKGKDGKKEFRLAAGVNDFFPYGGGPPVCPGRFIAKQQILTTVAMLVSRFEITPVGWVDLEGNPSDRPAENDARWCGGAAVPPDRDLKVKLRRLL
ncbi:cholesterol 7-alpha-monooxygenase 4 [Echria macrotheca]|uniref:Cholesterol 7-alpha-monooxygenase 4 n=1 Tax=Echria macrotheca TaxID=438768 RepID=A0AAJ0BMH6_9PEZI|nr:cholesterol 7-alpha-monooxygenase 4 [Echria macrotheca]